jgi:hypothetical protein
MQSTYCFSVNADAAPSSLGRVMDVFTLYGQVPSRLVSRLDEASGQDLVIDAQLETLTADVAAAVARRLQRVVGVTSVLYSEKRRWAA